jgi:hypothetical protein
MYITFLFLQARWRSVKRRTLKEIDLDEYGNMRIKLLTLKYTHFVYEYVSTSTCHYFYRKAQLLGWQKKGILPLLFNRNEYLKLLNESTSRHLSLGRNQARLVSQ